MKKSCKPVIGLCMVMYIYRYVAPMSDYEKKNLVYMRCARIRTYYVYMLRELCRELCLVSFFPEPIKIINEKINATGWLVKRVASTRRRRRC